MHENAESRSVNGAAFGVLLCFYFALYRAERGSDRVDALHHLHEPLKSAAAASLVDMV